MIDAIIKWNPRKDATPEKKKEWLEFAESRGSGASWTETRPGKRIGIFSVSIEEEFDGKICTTRRIMRIIERTIDKKGQGLLNPDIEIEGWWTTLSLPDEEVISLYCDHATSEQFHSEFKTDLDLERLPSGKFKTNDLILSLAVFTYNLLKWIGLTGLMDEHSPVRHKAKRRRIRTVMQELIYLAAHVYERGRRLRLRFGRSTPAFQAFRYVYQQLAYGRETLIAHQT